MKLVLGVEYCGTNFCGWQLQKKGVRTVQLVVEQALSKIANHKVRVFCAGRTDSGVHAKEQIIHFETTSHRSDTAWLIGSNSFLPNDVNFLWIKKVDNNFHARFDAYARQYNYQIYNSIMRSALKHNQYLWEPRKLNILNMQKASEFLLGTYDFSSFRGIHCQAKSAIKTIEFIQINLKNNIIIIDIKANAFLHHMVRNIVGSLLKIGYGEKKPEWLLQILEAKNRTKAGITAPAKGLYFIKAFYPNIKSHSL